MGLYVSSSERRISLASCDSYVKPVIQKTTNFLFQYLPFILKVMNYHYYVLRLFHGSSKNLLRRSTDGDTFSMLLYVSKTTSNAIPGQTKSLKKSSRKTTKKEQLLVRYKSRQIWRICTRRVGKLYKARSRLYRSQILQVNTKCSLESSRRDLHNALESNPLMKRNGRKEENGKT